MRGRPAVLLLILILLGYAVVATAYALYTPAWQAPDEPAHYNYVRHLLEHRALPVLQSGDYDFAYLERIKAARFPPDMPVDAIRYEFHQPPLYYVLAAVLAAPVPDASRPLALRFFSVILGCALLVVSYGAIRRAFPGRREWALGAVAFMAFLPMHVAQTAAISNDTLAELFVALSLAALLAGLDGRAGPSDDARLGVLLGLCLLTKTTAYVMLPVAALVLAARPYLRQRRSGRALEVRPALVSLVVVLGIALLIALPWFIRNVSVYGDTDILGLVRHDSIMTDQPHTADWLAAMGWWGLIGAFLSTTFHSFWGQFGWMGVVLDARIYLALGLLSAVAAVGLLGFAVRDAGRLPRRERATFAVMGVLLALMVIAYLYYNVQYVQHQGRYLFPALLPLALFFAVGTRFILGKISGVFGDCARPLAAALYALLFAGLWTLDIVCLVRFIVPQLAL